MGYRQDVPPVSLVSQFDDYDATDPRDKVYALLNLVDIDMLGLEPDYTKPVEKIYQDAAEAIIKTDRSLDILNTVRRSMETSSFAAGLLSWVPDFSQKQDTFTIALPPTHGTMVKRLRPVQQAGFIHKRSGGNLAVLGTRFDILEWSPARIPEDAGRNGLWEAIVRSGIYEEGNEMYFKSSHEVLCSTAAYNAGVTPSVFEHIKSTHRVVQRKSDYPSGGTYEDAIFKTLIMKQMATKKSGQPPDDNFVALSGPFRKWMGINEATCTLAEPHETRDPDRPTSNLSTFSKPHMNPMERRPTIITGNPIEGAFTALQRWSPSARPRVSSSQYFSKCLPGW
jgi:hypothetical protein